MDPRVCISCQAILVAATIDPLTGEETYKRTLRGSRQALAKSSCPLCQRFHQYLTTSQKDLSFTPDPLRREDDFELTLDNGPSLGSSNYLALRSPGLKQGRHDYLDMYADEGTEATAFTARRPRLFDMTSAACFAAIRTWIADCSCEHECYRGPRFSPTRLLRLDDAGIQPDVKLTSLSTELPLPYIVLSYCWGSAPTKDEQVRTLRANVDSHCTRIQVASLPQTIQDAIRVAREVRIPYLWVDALCIIQDDAEDVENEIAAMGTIYASAALTISASSAANSRDGFLVQRHDSGPLGRNPFVPVLYRAPGREKPCLVKLSPLGGDVAKVPLIWPCKEPLHTRGWTFQETLLSPRLLFFSAVQPYWLCKHGSRSAGDPKPDYFFLETGVERLKDLAQWRSATPRCGPPWHDIVQSYSRRKLSLPVDKLRAIHTLRVEHAAALGGTYWCGLWEKTLHVDLLWEATNKTERTSGELRLLSEGDDGWDDSKMYDEGTLPLYPSWSWARFDGAITYPIDWRNNERDYLATRVVDEILEVFHPPWCGQFGHLLAHPATSATLASEQNDTNYLGLRVRAKQVLVPRWRSRRHNMNSHLQSLSIEGDAAPEVEGDEKNDDFWPHHVRAFDVSIWNADQQRYELVPKDTDRGAPYLGRITFDQYSGDRLLSASETPAEDWTRPPIHLDVCLLASESWRDRVNRRARGIVTYPVHPGTRDDVRERVAVFSGTDGPSWVYFSDAVERAYKLV